MKVKMYLVLSLLVLLTSCGVERYKKFYVVEYQYKKHSYIYFKNEVAYGGSVIHNPDCKCFNK